MKCLTQSVKRFARRRAVLGVRGERILPAQKIEEQVSHRQSLAARLIFLDLTRSRDIYVRIHRRIYRPTDE